MTNEEAIEHLKNINSRYPCSLDSTFREECEQIALNLAIKALEEKPFEINVFLETADEETLEDIKKELEKVLDKLKERNDE